MPNFLFNALVFATLGIAIEVLFTGLVSAISGVRNGKLDVTLKGHSYLWMFPLYGLIGIVIPPLYTIIGDWNIFSRLLTYAVIIILGEIIFGFLIEKISGKCPWRYKSGITILRGYTRLDYLPLWMVFGLLIEYVFIYLELG